MFLFHSTNACSNLILGQFSDISLTQVVQLVLKNDLATGFFNENIPQKTIVGFFCFSELLRLVLVDLISELESSLTFRDLHTKLREFLQDAKNEYDFIKNVVDNNNRVTALRANLKQNRDNGEKILKDLNDEIMNIESHIYVNKIIFFNI